MNICSKTNKISSNIMFKNMSKKLSDAYIQSNFIKIVKYKKERIIIEKL